MGKIPEMLPKPACERLEAPLFQWRLTRIVRDSASTNLFTAGRLVVSKSSSSYSPLDRDEEALQSAMISVIARKVMRIQPFTPP
jgi:hypothetical protein